MQSIATPHTNPYDVKFFVDIGDGSSRSARVIVPLITKLVSPTSVVDVGCGVGCWLREFVNNGITDYLGVDGDYVDPTLLQIPRDQFQAMNLAAPIELDRKFSLATSLEVAEHLPKSAAPSFVRFLVGLAPVVMFSAAIPDQGGTHHVNEQWPWYWRSLFGDHGYVRVDAIRPEIMNDANVEFWYRQNVTVFVDEDRLADYPRLETLYRSQPTAPMELISEERLQQLVRGLGLKDAVRHLPRAAWRAIRRRWWANSPVTKHT